MQYRNHPEQAISCAGREGNGKCGAPNATPNAGIAERRKMEVRESGISVTIGRDRYGLADDQMNPSLPRRIYVASSWRNPHQPHVVTALRTAGHIVYDFRNPRPGDTGFHWSEISDDWQTWTAEQYRNALDHPVAQAGFLSDFGAMKWADTFVLVLPCGRSAHLETGWAIGQGKLTLILTRDGEEPELMALMADRICCSLGEVINTLA